jgi:predicted nucleic acid-binding Zn ribbon protein
MRRSNDQTLKEAINDMLDAYRLKGKLSEVGLTSSWEKIMGKTIASRTQQLFIKDKKLFVKLNSASLREELLYARQKMLDMLNAEAGEKVIEEIILM